MSKLRKTTKDSLGKAKGNLWQAKKTIRETKGHLQTTKEHQRNPMSDQGTHQKSYRNVERARRFRIIRLRSGPKVGFGEDTRRISGHQTSERSEGSILGTRKGLFLIITLRSGPKVGFLGRHKGNCLITRFRSGPKVGPGFWAHPSRMFAQTSERSEGRILDTRKGNFWLISLRSGLKVGFWIHTRGIFGGSGFGAVRR